MKITFSMIVLNATSTLPHGMLRKCIGAVYPYAHEIIIAEGATRACGNHYWDGDTSKLSPNGRSVDDTVRKLEFFPDPQNKITIIQTEGFWNGKTAMCNAIAKRATGNYIWQLDSDEFYLDSDIPKIIQLLKEENPDAVHFYANHFWGDFHHIISPQTARFWGNDEPWRRIFRHERGAKWNSHEPPDYELPGGRRCNLGRVMTRDFMASRGIRLFHYSNVCRNQAKMKSEFFRRPEYLQLWDYWQTNENIPLIKGARTAVYEGPHPSAITEYLNPNYVTFSLYGADPKYCVGAIKNADLMPKFYPDWQMIVYHDRTVPEKYLQALRDRNVILVSMTNYRIPRCLWRFLINDNPWYTRYIVRDADSRFTDREKYAVEEWIASGKKFHIMRDHPNHRDPIMAGMWGAMKGAVPEMGGLIQKYAPNDLGYGTDQCFLREIILPKVKDDCCIHDSGSPHKNAECLNFPKRVTQRFVGERMDENDTPNAQDAVFIKTDEIRLCIALQFWSGDRGVAMEVAKLCADIEPSFRNDIDFAFCARKDTEPDPATVEYLKKKFNVYVMKGISDLQGWPLGCNGLWHDTMNWADMQVRKGRVHWNALITIESDGVPLCKDWLNRMKSEWRSAGKLVVGCYIPGGEAPHFNGNAMFDATITGKFPALRETPVRWSWDAHHAPLLKQLGYDSGLFVSRFNTKTIDEATLYTPRLGNIAPAYHHGVKDCSARNIVRKKLGIRG